MHVVPRIMRQPEAFLDPQNAPKSLAAGASPQTPLGELSSRLPSWIQGVLLLRLLLLSGGEGTGGRGREGRAGQGRVCLVLKLPLATPLTTSGQYRDDDDDATLYISTQVRA